MSIELTAEMKKRLESLPEKKRIYLETYAEVCSNIDDFMDMLIAAEALNSGVSEKQVILNELVRKGVIEEGYQEENVVLTLVSECTEESGYRIASVIVDGVTGKTQYTVKIDIDEKATETHVCEFNGNGSKFICLDHGDALEGGQHDLSVTVFNSASAIVSSAHGKIDLVKIHVTEEPEPEEPKPEPACIIHCRSASIPKGKDQAEIAEIEFPAGTAAAYTVLLYNGRAENVLGVVHTGAGSPERFPVQYTRVRGIEGNVKARIRVVCNCEIIAEETCTLDVEPESIPAAAPSPTPSQAPAAAISKMHLEHRVDNVPVVDVNEVDEFGNVEICSVGIKSDTKANVSIQAFLSGDLICNEGLPVDGSWRTFEIKVPASSISKETSHNENLSVSAYDSTGAVIFCKNLGMTVRSKYDLYNMVTNEGLNTDKTRIRWAQFVNPLCEPVRKFVSDSNGPLAKVMGDAYHVTGYQSARNILPQMEAVFDAIRDMGFSYVSTTNTVPEEGMWFQYVRWPGRVLEDRSANCAEFSVLFASIFEAMGFEPIIVFPPGHAVVGVVVAADGYKSEAVDPGFKGSVELLTEAGKVKAILFEATLAAHDASFVDAIKSVQETLLDQVGEAEGQPIRVYDVVCALKQAVPITYMRRVKKIKPLV